MTLSDAKEAVQKELGGPGALLGYRAMAQKLRQKHNMKVPRDLVYDIMTDLDPEGLKQRAPGAKKVTKGHFITTGSNWAHSLDGHDKLMGYQNLTFPLAVYGCIDTASRYLIWLRVWKSNSDPVLVGKWYLDALFETQVLANFIRIDKGTETTIIRTMHAYLRSLQGDVENPSDSVIYGPSPSNQVSCIETHISLGRIATTSHSCCKFIKEMNLCHMLLITYSLYCTAT